MLTPVQNCKKCITFGNLRIISQEGDIRQQFVPFPPSFLKGGEVNFDYLPWRGESEKLKKRWKYHTGTDLLKRRGLALFPFFFQGVSFLHLEVTLCFAKLCHAFEENFFSFTII